jgi:hypothetical protein
MLVGLPVRFPAATAVPDKAMLSGLVEALFVIARLPLALPADWGLNTTLKEALWPGDNVMGRLSPEVLNPDPLTAACVTVRLVPPVLLRVLVWVWLVPTCTLPKLMLAGAALRLPGGAVCELDLPELNPWQPTMVAKANRAITARQRAGEWLIRFLSSMAKDDTVSVPVKDGLRKVPKGHAPGGSEGPIRKPPFARGYPHYRAANILLFLFALLFLFFFTSGASALTLAVARKPLWGFILDD